MLYTFGSADGGYFRIIPVEIIQIFKCIFKIAIMNIKLQLHNDKENLNQTKGFIKLEKQNIGSSSVLKQFC